MPWNGGQRFERFIVSRMVSHAISCYKSRPLSYNAVYFSLKNVSYTHLVEEKRNIALHLTYLFIDKDSLYVN